MIVRPTWEAAARGKALRPQVYGPVDAGSPSIMCPCGLLLVFSDVLREHWQLGHFDYVAPGPPDPQPERVVSSNAFRDEPDATDVLNAQGRRDELVRNARRLATAARDVLQCNNGPACSCRTYLAPRIAGLEEALEAFEAGGRP